jgi:phosphotransferase system IIB component
VTQENEKIFRFVEIKSIYDRNVYLYKSTNDEAFSVRFGKFLIKDKENFQVVIGNGGNDYALGKQIKEILSALHKM